MKKTKVKRIILLICIIVWAYLVFTFSSQDGGESSGLSRMVVDFFVKDPVLADKIEPYARKIAHFCEYALGGTLFISLFYTYEWTDNKRLGISIILGVWYAIIDEIHQLMVPGRNGAIVDVYIDSLGIATGVVGTMIIIKIIGIIKEKSKSKKIIKSEP